MSTRNVTRSAGCWARHPDTSATTRAASSPRPYAASPIRSCCSTRSRRRHPDVFNTLLQVLDDGRITDAQGRTVDFRNTVIIMTSNIGSHHLLDGVTPHGEIKPEARTAVMGELRHHFRPEFLNRIDDIVLFTPLALNQIERIVDLQFNQLRERLAEQGITVELTEAGRELIARHGFDPVYGARPLRRYISHEVETKIGRRCSAASSPMGLRDHRGRPRREARCQLYRRRRPGCRMRQRPWFCQHCGKKNRLPVAAKGTPKCGNCHEPLPWIVDAGDADFSEISRAGLGPCARRSLGRVVRAVPPGPPCPRPAGA